MDEFSQYLKRKRLEISAQLREQTIIYLDLNYWIRLRNEKRVQAEANHEFLDAVFNLSKNRKCIFPISEMTFYEIMKQSDLDSRRATTELVDQLSGGISIIDMQERVFLETRVWLLKASGQPVHELNELVWTKFAFALGYHQIIKLPSFPLKEAAFELFENASLVDLIGHITDVFTHKDDVDLYNEQVKKFAHQNKSYEETFLSELAGFIDANAETIKDVMNSMYHKESGKYMSSEERLADRTPQLVYNAIRLGVVKNELPLFHIIPTLHAWTRWKQKPFKDGNDTMDFYHASFALPYADYFFTDRRLCNAIKERQLDSLYQCRVEHHIDKVMEAIASI